MTIKHNDPAKAFEPFSLIDAGLVIVIGAGVYRQVKLARRAGHLYAQHGAGYVKLYPKGGTSSPAVKWHQIDPGPGADFTESGLGVEFVSLEAAE